MKIEFGLVEYVETTHQNARNLFFPGCIVDHVKHIKSLKIYLITGFTYVFFFYIEPFH